MGGSKDRSVGAELVQARQRFRTWRRTRKTGTRIPASLWAMAVELAQSQGLSRTASELGLDYDALKKRVASAMADRPSSACSFVELVPPAAAGECIIEFEDVAGSRMRVHLKGYAAPDVAALGRSFWAD